MRCSAFNAEVTGASSTRFFLSLYVGHECLFRFTLPTLGTRLFLVTSGWSYPRCLPSLSNSFFQVIPVFLSQGLLGLQASRAWPRRGDVLRPLQFFFFFPLGKQNQYFLYFLSPLHTLNHYWWIFGHHSQQENFEVELFVRISEKLRGFLGLEMELKASTIC